MSNGKGRAAAESPLQADWQPREASPESLPSSHRSGGRPFAEWVPDFPFMAERVDDASKTPAMFVMHSGCFDRTGLDGGCDQRFGCVDDEECPPVAPPILSGLKRFRAESDRATQNAASPTAS